MRGWFLACLILCVAASECAHADAVQTGAYESVKALGSIGVASSDTLGVWGDNLVSRADAAVYAAKRGGRNQLFVAQPGVS